MEAASKVTLAINSAKTGRRNARILADHGIDVDVVPDGMHVILKVVAEDVAEAVKLLEEQVMVRTVTQSQMQNEGMGSRLLIPVDFSSYAEMACRVGFEFASSLDMKACVLHSYPMLEFGEALTFDNSGPDGSGLQPVDAMMAAQEDTVVREQALKQMRSLRKKIDEAMASGSIPEVEYSTDVREGVPEEVILECSKTMKPSLIVMATRGSDKKKEELVGSVTAEVLDSCRVPVFTVPENYDFPGVAEIRRLVFFCNLEGQDALSMAEFMHLFNCPEVDITLIPVNEKAGDVKGKVERLRNYFEQNYVGVNFQTRVFAAKSFRQEMEAFMQSEDIQLFVVPNKKINIFRRLFNPGIAHKILFERDVPMLALPV